MKNINWQKVVTREFSFLWASYTAEAYRVMQKLTGTTLKFNLFYTEGRTLTIYRDPKDVAKSYRLIEKLTKSNPQKALENMDNFENYFEEGINLFKKITNSTNNKNQIAKMLLEFDKTFVKIISYYLFVVFLGYAGDSPANKRFISLNKTQFERIRMSTMDADFHIFLPKAFSKFNNKLKNNALFMTRDELIGALNKKVVSWPKVKHRKKNALIIVKDSKEKEIQSSKIIFTLKKELSHLRFNKHAKIIKGAVAYKGLIKGRVIKISKKSEYNLISKGDILVISMTKPDIIPYLKKVKGIITNDGGALSHASILSRELKIPCIVGTMYATDILNSGDLVVLDANTGIIKKL